MSARSRPAAALLLVLCAGMIAGCGSSASTSSADVTAVAAAEQELANATHQANELAQENCRSERGAAGTHCLSMVTRPRERRAGYTFVVAIKRILASGVGSGCEAALKEALLTVGDVPFFTGDTAAKCRAEINQTE
jgi:curli biogenesis system outer membrane secretion channel CsgG